MAKQKKQYEKSNLSEELLEIIRVTPEQTAKALSKLKYTIHERPEGIKAKKGELWCCYCGDFKKFGKSKKSKDFDYARCESCNISIEDWHIKQLNHLWITKKEK